MQVPKLKVLSLLVCVSVFFCCNKKPSYDLSKPIISVNEKKLESWRVIPGSENESYSVVKDSLSDRYFLLTDGVDKHAIDYAYLDRCIRQLSDLKAIKLVDSEADLDSLGLGRKATKVIINQVGKEKIVLLVGKMDFLGTNQTHYYIQIEGQEPIFITDRYLEASLAAPLEKIRQKEMIPIPSQQIVEVHLSSSDERQIDIKPEKGVWTVNGKEANQGKIMDYFTLLTTLKADKFVKKPNIAPEFSIILLPAQLPAVSLRIYRVYDHEWALESSLNPGNYMFMDDAKFVAVFPSAKDLF